MHVLLRIMCPASYYAPIHAFPSLCHVLITMSCSVLCGVLLCTLPMPVSWLVPRSTYWCASVPKYNISDSCNALYIYLVVVYSETPTCGLSLECKNLYIRGAITTLKSRHLSNQDAFCWSQRCPHTFQRFRRPLGVCPVGRVLAHVLTCSVP